MTNRVVALMVGLMLSLSATAWSAQANVGPEELVKQTTDKLLAALQADQGKIKKDPERVYRLVQEIALPHFDFERISRWVLGRYWRRATPEQRKRFEKEFTTLLVRTYATALTEYQGQKVTLDPVHMKPGDTDVKVKAEVQQPGAFPIPIVYRMYLKDGQWKVYDVVIDEVSLVANYRTAFAGEISAGGINKLINTLASRNRSDIDAPKTKH